MTEHNKTDNEPNEPDLAKLASEYMDLWQKQLSDMASDKDIAALMAQSIELMNSGASSMANIVNKANTDPAQTGMENEANDDTSSHSDTQHQNRATPTCPACGIANDAISDLTQRIKQLEERIAAMEATSGKGSQ